MRIQIYISVFGVKGSDQPRTTRLPGYSIRVSNDSALPSPESICYQDPGNPIQMILIENNCEMTGQFVWIYQNHTLHGKSPILEICEVKVFGKCLFFIYSL